MFDDFLDNLTGDASNLVDTATAFGSGAIATAISGNPLYSQDPAAAAYAVNQAKPTTTIAGNKNLLFLLVIGYVVLKLAK